MKIRPAFFKNPICLFPCHPQWELPFCFRLFQHRQQAFLLQGLRAVSCQPGCQRSRLEGFAFFHRIAQHGNQIGITGGVNHPPGRKALQSILFRQQHFCARFCFRGPGQHGMEPNFHLIFPAHPIDSLLIQKRIQANLHFPVRLYRLIHIRDNRAAQLRHFLNHTPAGAVDDLLAPCIK